MRMIVYRVLSPSKKVYIGISKFSLDKRRSEHLNEALNKNSKLPLHRAIRTYGDSLKWEIIDSAEDWDSLCILEKMYISHYQSFSKGYNCTRGGDGNTGKGKSGPDNPMYGKSGFWRDKKLPEELVRKMKESWTADKKDRLSLLKGGRLFRVIAVKVIPAKRSPRYIPRTIEDREVVGEWISQNQCGRDLNIDPCYINKCLKGKKKTCKGYRFEYV